MSDFDNTISDASITDNLTDEQVAQLENEFPEFITMSFAEFEELVKRFRKLGDDVAQMMQLMAAGFAAVVQPSMNIINTIAEKNGLSFDNTESNPNNVSDL
jgi:hypothetical protein